MGQSWRPPKGRTHHAQEFGLGLTAVTGAFGPGNDRAVCAAQEGPLCHVGWSVREQAGSWEIRKEWTSAAAQGRSDQA